MTAPSGVTPEEGHQLDALVEAQQEVEERRERVLLHMPVDVRSASLVVIAATLPLFKIPEGGLLLILAIDHFLDMGRTATNVIGNAVASAVVAKWEGGLDAPQAVVDGGPVSAVHPVEAESDKLR